LQRRYADGSVELFRETLAGSVAPEEGAEVEFGGHQWRVIDTTPVRDWIRVVQVEQVDAA